MIADLCAPLNQGVDAIVYRGNRNDLDIIPGQAAGGERTKDTEPDRQMRGIITGHPPAFDIVDSFYRAIFTRDHAGQQGGAAHDQTRARRVRHGIAPAYFETLSLIRESHVHSIDNAEVELAFAEIISGTGDPDLLVSALLGLQAQAIAPSLMLPGRSRENLEPALVRALVETAEVDDERVRRAALATMRAHPEQPEIRAVLESVLEDNPQLARELQQRLQPKTLANEAWEKAKNKGADLAEDAVDAVAKRPVAVGSVVAALAMFLAREPLKKATVKFYDVMTPLFEPRKKTAALKPRPAAKPARTTAKRPAPKKQVQAPRRAATKKTEKA